MAQLIWTFVVAMAVAFVSLQQFQKQHSFSTPWVENSNSYSTSFEKIEIY